MYSRCGAAMTKMAPATFAPSCRSTIGCAIRIAMSPQTTSTVKHRVVDRAHVAPAPRAHATAPGPQDVGNGADHALEVVELRLEQQPRAEKGDHASGDGARLVPDCGRQRGADPKALNVGAARQEGDVEQRR